MENKLVKKSSNKTLSLAEVKALVKFMKEEKVASFQVGDIAINFHPLAFVNENVINNPGQTTHKANNKQPVIDDDPLFDAVE